MIYLDTHIVVWLYAGITNIFSATVRELINRNQPYISPIVRLELQYLYDINRVLDEPNMIVADLSNSIGLQVDDKHFDTIIGEAMAISWTRDPFDRIIVANAALNNNVLVTKDRTILSNYLFARW